LARKIEQLADAFDSQLVQRLDVIRRNSQGGQWKRTKAGFPFSRRNDDDVAIAGVSEGPGDAGGVGQGATEFPAVRPKIMDEHFEERAFAVEEVLAAF